MKKLALICSVWVLGFSCSSSSEKSSIDQPLVEDKYRLTKDRDSLEEIRKDVPPERQAENDELAFMLQWMGKVEKHPSQIREKFNSVVSKKRQVFQKDMTRRREDYVKKERKDREVFNKEIEKTRKSFVASKPAPEERREFFNDLETKRKDFYTDQREKRDDFEADMRDRRKNFEDYIRERNMEFNQEHRAYTKRYEDDQKQKREAKKKDSGSQPFLDSEDGGS